MNKLTVGLESQRSLWAVLLFFLFPPAGLPWIFMTLSVCSRGPGQKHLDPQRDEKSYVTSDWCDVTPQICQPSAPTVLGLHSWVDDICFFPVSNDSNTPHLQYNAAFCTPNFSIRWLQGFQWLQRHVSSSSQFPRFYLQVNVRSNVSPCRHKTRIKFSSL